MMRVPHSVLSSATYTTLRVRVVALPAAPLPVPWMPSQMQLLMSLQGGAGVQPMSPQMTAAYIFTAFVPAPAAVVV